MKYDISEAHLNRPDTKAIFKTATELKNKSPGGFFGGLKKDKIDINDLQRSWKEMGFPDDTKDIEGILKKYGFGDKEIKKVFSRVFGSHDKEYDEPVATPAIQKIVKYVKDNGLVDDIKSFLEREYGEELGISKPKNAFDKISDVGKKLYKKAVTEEIREIFTFIIEEERTERLRLIKEQEQVCLGRSKKNESRLEEISLGDALKANQYIKLLHNLKSKANNDIKIGHIKNQIIQSWKRGMKSRKHYDSLLGQIHLNLHDLIGK